MGSALELDERDEIRSRSGELAADLDRNVVVVAVEDEHGYDPGPNDAAHQQPDQLSAE